MALEKFVIEGGHPLRGEVTVSGSKNASLPLLAATILAEGECDLGGIPRLRDVDTMAQIMTMLGVEIERGPGGRVRTKVINESASRAPYELVSQMRASFCTLGPLLAKRGYAEVSMPGGCQFGDRPVDLHLKGMRALGAEVRIEKGYVIARAKALRGRPIYLGGPAGSSVLGTANLMMAAVLAEGTTTIEHAACEPEVVDLANFLIKMGASIEGAGSHRIVIRGVRRLEGASHNVIPDRIEAGTLMAAAAATRGEVVFRNYEASHLEAVFDRFHEAGVNINRNCRTITVGMDRRPRECEVTTLPYPGFPTDLQAPMMSMLCLAQGASIFTDTIYPDRLNHVAELARMGARIKRVNETCIIVGVERLQGAEVMACDLRAGAALTVAGLCAEGETTVHRIYHIDRGYESFENKLKSLGAVIRREPDTGPEHPPTL